MTKIIWKIDRKPVLLRDEFKRTSAFLLGLKEFRRAAVLGAAIPRLPALAGSFGIALYRLLLHSSGQAGGPVSSRVEIFFFIIWVLGELVPETCTKTTLLPTEK